MVQTFGLTKGRNVPSVEELNAVLDANTSKLMDVITALVNGVNGYLKDNELKLDFVVNRLVNSVNGHIKRNFGILKPIGNELVGHVNGMLAQNDAILSTAASNPAIADYLRLSPAAQGLGLAAPEVPPAETLALPLWTLYANCTTQEVMAVPVANRTGQWQGWNPSPAWIEVGQQHLVLSQVEDYLRQNRALLLSGECPHLR